MDIIQNVLFVCVIFIHILQICKSETRVEKMMAINLLVCTTGWCFATNT